MKNKRIVVAMSGGVDSSVAAGILKNQGHEIIGVTMCFGTDLYEPGTKHPACCGLDAIDDAKKVAQKLGIKHYVINFGKIFQKEVIDEFIKSYLCGQTPNPCIRCNRLIKFGALWQKAQELDADFLATGHFARIESVKVSKSFILKKGKDSKYDQSYFLSALKKEDLKHFILPLGNFTKERVRRIAKDLKLPTAEKPSSQDICFGGKDYREFFKKHSQEFKPGPLKLSSGKIVGEHKGIGFYTIGQREGLGIALGKPQYVNRIDAQNNTIYIGDKAECLFSGCLVKDLNIFSEVKTKSFATTVKIRYNHNPAACDFKIKGDLAQIIFETPQFAVTPGQAAVVYLKDKVLFGATIIEQIK